MAVAAAFTGIRVAKNVDITSAQAQINKEYRLARQKLADKIIEAFDTDGSGGISETELVPLLEQSSLQVYGEETHPSPEDIQFLLSLSREENDKIGEVKRSKILFVCDAWYEFIQAKATVMQLIQDHDVDRNSHIDQNELQLILNQISDQDKVSVVQSEVTAWIFSQADISQTGLLTFMEVARALCIYELWVGRTLAAPQNIMKGAEKTQHLTPPRKMSSEDWAKHQSLRDKIIETLKKFDLNGDSVFEVQEISELCVRLGLTAEDGAQLHKMMDLNGDSKVSVDEFLNFAFAGSAEADRLCNVMHPSTGKKSETSASACVIS